MFSGLKPDLSHFNSHVMKIKILALLFVVGLFVVACSLNKPESNHKAHSAQPVK